MPGLDKTTRFVKRTLNRASLRGLVWALLLAWGILLVFYVIHKIFSISMEEFLFDPSEIMNTPFYFGILSYAGVVLWGASVAVSLFAYFALGREERRSRGARYLLILGLFTLMLLLDDQLRIHETIFGHYLNVREYYVFGFYTLLLVVIIAVFWIEIMANELLLFAAAWSLFGFSTIIDQLEIQFPGEALVEDGAKFLGIAVWLAYAMRLGWNLLSRSRE